MVFGVGKLGQVALPVAKAPPDLAEIAPGDATVTPSGRINPRYSPGASSLKFVCSGLPGVRRFLFEAIGF